MSFFEVSCGLTTVRRDSNICVARFAGLWARQESHSGNRMILPEDNTCSIHDNIKRCTLCSLFVRGIRRLLTAGQLDGYAVK